MKQTTIIKTKEGVQWTRPLDFILQTIPNGTYTVTIAKQVKHRTLPQNALMWMWFACISQETGQPLDDVHDTYCALFLSRIAINARGEEVRVYHGTSKLNTAEMTEFMDRVQADAAEMGIRLPQPTDEYYEEFINEYKNRVQLS